MGTLIHADVFFFVTTIAIILLGIGLIVVLIYVIKILKDVRQISSKVRVEGEEIIKDMAAIRQSFKEKSLSFLDVLSVIGKYIHPKKRSRKIIKDE